MPNALAKKFKSRVHKFYTPLYNQAIVLVVSNDIHKALENMADTFPGYDKNAGDGASAFVVENRAACTFGLFVPQEIPISHLAHELYHLTNRVLHNIGHTIDQTNDEPGAYLCGWLAGKVVKILAD